MVKFKRSQIGNFILVIVLLGTFFLLGGYFGNSDESDRKNLLDFFYKLAAILFPSSLITFYVLSEKIIKSDGYVLKSKDKTDFVNNTKINTVIYSKIIMLLAYWLVFVSGGIIVPVLWFLLKSEGAI